MQKDGLKFLKGVKRISSEPFRVFPSFCSSACYGVLDVDISLHELESLVLAICLNQALVLISKLIHDYCFYFLFLADYCFCWGIEFNV